MKYRLFRSIGGTVKAYIHQIDLTLFLSDFSDIVTSRLSDYKPDSIPRSSQYGSLFYPRQIRTKTFNKALYKSSGQYWNRLPTDLRQEQSLDGSLRKLNSFSYISKQF